MQTTIARNSKELKRGSEIAKPPEVFVEGKRPAPNDPICGKLQYQGTQGDLTYYSEISSGCVWIYLTDCSGNVEAAMQHLCVVGNTLEVQGCHAFGCSC